MVAAITCWSAALALWLLPRTSAQVGMANPASVHCEENGGTSEIRTDDSGGEFGVCMFPDGSECEEWAYLQGECGPETSPEGDQQCIPDCLEGGAPYYAGDSFLSSDGCNTCQCEGGLVACTERSCGTTCQAESMTLFGHRTRSLGVGEMFRCADGCNTCTCTVEEDETAVIISTEMACAAECETDDDCSTRIRSRVPDGYAGDIGLCDCYALGTVPFDECEGREEECATAKCAAGACQCKEAACQSGLCVLVNEYESSAEYASPFECSALSTCQECLAQDGCDAWSVGECFPSCSSAPQDVGCYSQEYISGTPESICAQAESDTEDDTLCSNMANCTQCVDTVLSDGESTCMWFSDFDFCAAGCGMMGCGDTVCEPEPLPECSALSTCQECLAQDGCDAWSVGECFPSCSSAPQDVGCYSQEYIDGTPESICEQAESDAGDDILCSGMANCTQCVGTVLSDGESTCQWFSEDEVCAAGCGMNGCGDTVCAGSSGQPDLDPTEPLTDPDSSSACCIILSFLFPPIVTALSTMLMVHE